MRHLAPVLLLLLILSPPDLTAGEFDGSWKGALIAEFGDRDGSCGFKKSPLRAHVENGRLRVTGIDLAQKEQVFEDEIAADGEFEAWGWWGIGGTTGGVATGRGKLSGLFLGTRSFLGEFYASLDGGGTCVAKVFLKRAPETAETEHGRAPTQRGVAFVAAARKGDLGAVEKALSDGTDVNARDGIGSTALMMAARRGDVALVRRLIDVGANPGLTNTLGQSAVILATKHGHKKVAAILRSGVASNIGGVFDGRWRGAMLCEGFGQGYIVEVTINGTDVSSLTGIEGRVDGDGNISLYGTDDYTGDVETVGFSGWYGEAEFRLDGKRGGRACDMVMTWLEPVPSAPAAVARTSAADAHAKAEAERQRQLAEAARAEAKIARQELQEILARQQAASEKARLDEEDVSQKAEAERQRLVQEVSRLKEEAERARVIAAAAANQQE